MGTLVLEQLFMILPPDLNESELSEHIKLHEDRLLSLLVPRNTDSGNERSKAKSALNLMLAILVNLAARQSIKTIDTDKVD
jgi:hypothetical protein